MQKEKREIIYSVIVLITVPLLVLSNTLYFFFTVRKAFNNEISRKADLTNSVIAEALKPEIAAKKSVDLTQKLNLLQKQQPELTKLSILTDVNGEITALAQTDDSDKTISSSAAMQARVAYEKKLPIARFVSLSTQQGQQRAWNVATPVMDDSNQKVIAVVNSNLLTGESEALLSNVVNRSLLIVLASLVVILVLLFRHLRFVEYARLLARQREINQTMSDFLSVATHELKAPTAIIKGYISNAIDESGPSMTDSAKQQLDVALAQTDRLNNLVKDLLNVSRVEQGRVEYNIESVRIYDVIKPIIDNYQPIAAQKSILINYSPDDFYFVMADSGRVQEIFTNLIDNAIKYSTGGEVKITQRISGKMLVTAVRDSGIGMSAEQRQRLFQRFYRIKSDQTKDISGTGLGLWIIKQYIETMNGTITVDSMLGSGSEFSVSLPLVDSVSAT